MKKHGVFISLIIVCIMLFIITTFMPFYVVEGDSMNPTLKKDDVVCIKKTKTFHTGDLIAFQSNNKMLVRRVIAFGGDKVNIDQDGYVFVNNKKVNDRYVKSRKDNPVRDEVFPYTVPTGKIFVLGDNRSSAIDSRMRDLGCVDNKEIIGKVVMKVYPITHFSVY